MKRIIYSLIFISLIISSCNKPTIDGRVVDMFGIPIDQVKVTIEGTSLETFTNNNGFYESDYVPGNIKVNLSKDGYTPRSFTIEIAEKTDFPAQDVIMIKSPEPNGIYYIDKDNKKYADLPRFAFKIEKGLLKEATYFDKPNNQYISQYYIEIEDPNILTLDKGESQFIYHSDFGGRTLYKLMWFEGTDRFNVLSISYWQKNESKRTISFQNKIYQNVIKQDKDKTDEPFATIIKLDLDHGYYAFANYKGIQGDMLEPDSLMVFKVVER